MLSSRILLQTTKENRAMAPPMLLSFSGFATQQWSPQLHLANALPFLSPLVCGPWSNPGQWKQSLGGAAWSLPRKAAYLCPFSSLEVPRRKAHLCNILCTSHLVLVQDESTCVGAIQSLISQGRVWLNLTLFSMHDDVFGICWLQVGKQVP